MRLRPTSLLVLSVLAGGFVGARTTHAEPPAAAPVRAAPVVEAEVREARTFVGSVRALRRAELGSGVDGYVKELLAREGQRVEQGAVLLRLELDLIAPELEAARAERLRAGHALEELVNGTRVELVTEAEARLAEADVEVAAAERKLETARRLQVSKHVSGEEVRDAEDALRAAEASRRRTSAVLALLRSGTRDEQVEQGRAELLRRVADVKRLEALEARHTVEAPFAGYVVVEHTEVGAWLSRGDPILTIEALDTVRVRFPVLEDYVHALAPGAAVLVELGSLPDRVFEGVIERVVPTADPVARTVPVDVTMQNERTPSGVLVKSGMFARARLPVGPSSLERLVPLDALVLGGPTPAVFVIDDDGTVASVPVELGAAIGGQVVVRGALEAGMLVVTEGNERLRPGQSVRVLEE